MRFTAKRLLGAGIIGIAAIVTPVAITVGIPAISSGPASIAFAAPGSSCPAQPTNDEICYSQSTGKSGTFAQYMPATTGGHGTATSVGLTSGGGCSATKWSSAPVLDFSGQVYANGTYTSTPSAAQVDASSQKTGTCGINGSGTNPWAIDDTTAGAESLSFLIGTNSIVSGRLFSEASLQLSNVNSTSAHVTLIETQAGVQTGTQSCTLAGSATITADTNGGGTCAETGQSPVGTFDTIQIEVPDLNSSVTVVGPTSVFTLAPVLCGGHSISTPTGDVVSATLYMTGSSTDCKTYTTFSSSIVSGQSVLNFNGSSNTPVTFTVKITWPLQAECQPYNDGSIPTDLTLPMCPPHQISVNGKDYFDQAYCQSPNTGAEQPQGGMCTISKTYNNDQQTIDPNTGAVTGTTGLTLPEPPCVPSAANNNCAATQITEVWTGDIDMTWR